MLEPLKESRARGPANLASEFRFRTLVPCFKHRELSNRTVTGNLKEPRALMGSKEPWAVLRARRPEYLQLKDGRTAEQCDRGMITYRCGCRVPRAF